ncbi:MAG: YqgE/AlgH family protein [Proteobacteria bacterium]|nr:YqgE/AlgH family protein [Pseudomonadota bacterium]
MFTLLAFLLACGSPEPTPSPIAEPAWRSEMEAWSFGDPIPDVPLTDQEGNAFQLADTRDGWLALGFIYTRCPKAEACPMTMGKLVALDAAHQANPAGKLSLLAVTLDPGHDGPEQLKAYGSRFGAAPERFRLATGDAALVSEDLPSLFNVVALDGPEDTLDHTVRIVLIEPGGRAVSWWSDDAISVEHMLARMHDPLPCSLGVLQASSGPSASAFEHHSVALCAQGDEGAWGLLLDKPGVGGPMGEQVNTLFPGTDGWAYRPGEHRGGTVVRGITSWSPGQLEAELSEGRWTVALASAPSRRP